MKDAYGPCSCPACRGTGIFGRVKNGKICEDCKGSGEVSDDEEGPAKH